MVSTDVILLIGTCDKYSFLWKEFVFLFNKYWDNNIKIEKYFMTETLVDDSIEGFKFIKNGKIPYSNCLINTLNQISTKYVLWMQDDYFLRRTIKKEMFDDYLKFVKENNVDRLGICEDSKYYSKKHINDNFFKLNKNSQYTISMQSSIWNTEFFKSCVIPNETPWMFEINGTKRLNRRNHSTYIVTQNPPWYLEALRKGKYTDWYYKIKKEEKI
jgi:hypothetical protein